MFDCFIKIDGIEGESTDAKHPGWIEVLLYDTAVNQKVSSTASSVGGASSERANFGTFNFTKELDKATPKLALACADGTHINNIVLEVYRASGDKLKFSEYRLVNCIICDVYTSGFGGDLPMENIKINFGKIDWSHVQQKRAGGGAAGNIAAGWDLEKNCKI